VKKSRKVQFKPFFFLFAYMKILAINGSHRKGNTEAILKRVLDGARAKGAQIELINLRDQEVENCKACMACETTHSCRIQDDFPKIFQKMANADTLVLGSPNYFNNVSALMKKFIDRMNPHWEDPRLRGKKVVLVMPGGQGGKSAEAGLNAFEQFPKICQMKVIEKLAPKADRATEAQNDPELMEKCFSLGERLASA
jgi:multimeric flavodoxin WrbA